jgi:hypothetical protein
MKCVRLLVNSKQIIASLRAEGTKLGPGNTRGLQNTELFFSKYNDFHFISSQSW